MTTKELLRYLYGKIVDEPKSEDDVPPWRTCASLDRIEADLEEDYDMERLRSVGDIAFPSFVTDQREQDFFLRLCFSSIVLDEYSFSLENGLVEVKMKVSMPDSSRGDLPENVEFKVSELTLFQYASVLENMLSSAATLSDVDEGIRWAPMHDLRVKQFTDRVTVFTTPLLHGDGMKAEGFSDEKELLTWSVALSSLRIPGFSDSIPLKDPASLRRAYLSLPEGIRRWLILDIGADVTFIRRMVSALSADPSGIPSASKILMVRVKTLMEMWKDSKEKRMLKAEKRIALWTELFGGASFGEAFLLSRTWDVPYAYLHLKGNVNVSLEDLRLLAKEELSGPSSYKDELAFAFYRHLLNISSSRSASGPALRNPGDFDEFDSLEVPTDPEAFLSGVRRSPQRSVVLVKGPSGSGKTYNIRRMAELLGLPYLHINMASSVQEGIVGQTFANSFEGLQRSDCPKELKRYAVGNFDEVEKPHHYRDALQNQLLELCDKGGAISVGREPGPKETIQTGDMLFFLSGVFADVDKLRSKVGFSSIGRDDSARALTKADFAESGISYELLGRITLILSISNPAEDEVLEFLSGKNSPFVRYDSLLREEGSSLVVTDDGKKAIARKVASGKMGYRMIDNILYSLYRSHHLSRPSCDAALIVDGEAVEAAA